MRITLGPVPGLWPGEQLYRFYEDALHWPLAAIYVGETVCSKRRSLRTDDWIELARTIQRRGIQAVLSTLTLIEARSELAVLKRLCDNDGLLVEANDYAAVRLLHERRVPWVAGATLNVYNRATLAWLIGHGLQRWQPPVDLDLPSLAKLRDALGPQWPETEMLAWGRLPLAWSARCFAARAYQRPKDDCGFVCDRHPDGLRVNTREGMPFLAINGIQVLSADVRDLSGELPALAGAGVSLLRVSPMAYRTGAAVRKLARAAAAIPAGSATASPVRCRP